MGPNAGIGDLASTLSTPDLGPLITGEVALDEAISIARSHLQGPAPDPHYKTTQTRPPDLPPVLGQPGH